MTTAMMAMMIAIMMTVQATDTVTLGTARKSEEKKYIYKFSKVQRTDGFNAQSEGDLRHLKNLFKEIVQFPNCRPENLETIVRDQHP